MLFEYMNLMGIMHPRKFQTKTSRGLLKRTYSGDKTTMKLFSVILKGLQAVKYKTCRQFQLPFRTFFCWRGSYIKFKCRVSFSAEGFRERSMVDVKVNLDIQGLNTQKSKYKENMYITFIMCYIMLYIMNCCCYSLIEKFLS